MPSRATKFEKLLVAVPDALVGMDQEGMIRFVNTQTEQLFGYDRDQLIGQPIETVLPEPLWQIYAQNRDEYFADPRTRSMGLEVELVGLRHDGTEFPVNVSMAHIDTGDVLLEIAAIADVSRRDAAVKNAELIAAIVQSSDDAIIASTLRGIITSWNPAAERMYGYSAAEMIGRSGSVVTPDDRTVEVTPFLARLKDGEAVQHVEATLVRKDGSVFPVSITVSPIRDEDGVVVGVCAVHRDVSEQRKAFETAQTLAVIVENSEDAIVSVSLDGTLTSWNPAAEAMFGYSSAEVLGKSADFLTPRDRAGELRDVLAQVWAGHHVGSLETESVRKDATVVPVSLTVSPVRDADGAIVGASGTYRDITAQREAFGTAQAMAAIVQGSDDAIFGSTLEGTITSWNQAATRLFGYPSSEMIGQSGRLLSPKDRTDEVKTILAKVGAGQHVEHLETIRVRKDGTVFPVSLTVSPIRDASGAVIGASAISRNMTELQHAASYARSLIEAGLDPLLTISADGTINDVNEATVKVTGVPRDQLIGTDCSAYFTQPDKAHGVYERAFAQGSVTDYPLTVRHRDGTLTDLACNASVYRDFNANVLGVLATGRNVTEQKRAFEVAQAMAAIVEGSHDAILSASLEGIITSWNPAAQRMYGYSSAEIIGKHVASLNSRDRTAEVKDIVDTIKAGRHVEYLETEHVRKDGTVFPVALTISPLRDRDGMVVGGSAIHRDLTEQKSASAAAERVAAIVEYSNDAIMGRTLEGIITSWNPAAMRMFGYSGQEVVGKSIDLLIPADRAGEMISIMAKIRAGQSVDNFETIRLRKNATEFPVSLTVSPIRDEQGKVVGASATCRDLSELRRAAQYARSLIEAGLDPMATISPDGKINDVNQATLAATGVPRNELIGTDFSAYFTEPDKAHAAYQRAFAQGSVTDCPLILRHRDGKLIHVLYNASVYRGALGEVLGVLAVARDVTAQKRAFEVAQAMAAIVHSSNDGIVSASLDGAIMSWNPAAERMYGYSSAEIIGRAVSTLIPKDRTKEVKDVQKRIRAGRHVEHLETERVRKDGKLLPVSLTFSPVRDANGALVGTSVIHRDLTEHKEALESAQLSAVIEFSGEAITSVDLDRIITSFNPAAETLYGYSAAEVIGMHAGIMTPEDRNDEVDAAMKEISAGHVIENFETLRLRKDGTAFPALLTISPIRDADAVVVGASMVTRDVTAQRAAFETVQAMAPSQGRSGDAIVMCTLAGVITSWNAAAERLHGYLSEAMIGTSMELLSPQDRTGEITSILARVKAGQPVEPTETRCIRRDGIAIPVSLTVLPIRDTKGSVVGASVIYADLTQHR